MQMTSKNIAPSDQYIILVSHTSRPHLCHHLTNPISFSHEKQTHLYDLHVTV